MTYSVKSFIKFPLISSEFYKSYEGDIINIVDIGIF